MKALVWRSIKLFSKRGEHHHRSGEEEPLVERRREALSHSLSLSMIEGESESESESESDGASFLLSTKGSSSPDR